MTRECPLCKKAARVGDCLRLGKSRLQRLQAQGAGAGVEADTWAHRTCAQQLGIKGAHEPVGTNSSLPQDAGDTATDDHRNAGDMPAIGQNSSLTRDADVQAADDMSPDDSVSVAGNGGSTLSLARLPVVHLQQASTEMPVSERDGVMQEVTWHEEYIGRLQALVERQRDTNELRRSNANEDSAILNQEAENLQKKSIVQKQHMTFLQEERSRDNLVTELLQHQLRAEEQQEVMKLKSATQLLQQQLHEAQLRTRMKDFPEVQQFVANLKASGITDRAALRLVFDRYSWLSNSARIAPKKILELRYVTDMLVAEEIVSAALCPIVGDTAQQVRTGFKRAIADESEQKKQQRVG